MFIIVAALLAVVVIGAIAFFFSGKRNSLPEANEPRQEPTPEKRPPAVEKKADAPALIAPVKKAEAEIAPVEQAKAEPAPKAEEPVAAPEPVVEPVPAPKPADAAPVRPASLRPPRAEPDTMQAFKKGLATTRGGFIARLAQLFGREVDLVEEKALRNPVLIRRIARERVPLFRPA